MLSTNPLRYFQFYGRPVPSSRPPQKPDTVKKTAAVKNRVFVTPSIVYATKTLQRPNTTQRSKSVILSKSASASQITIPHKSVWKKRPYLTVAISAAAIAIAVCAGFKYFTPQIPTPPPTRPHIGIPAITVASSIILAFARKTFTKRENKPTPAKVVSPKEFDARLGRAAKEFDRQRWEKK